MQHDNEVTFARRFTDPSYVLVGNVNMEILAVIIADK